MNLVAQGPLHSWTDSVGMGKRAGRPSEDASDVAFRLFMSGVKGDDAIRIAGASVTKECLKKRRSRENTQRATAEVSTSQPTATRARQPCPAGAAATTATPTTAAGTSAIMSQRVVASKYGPAQSTPGPGKGHPISGIRHSGRQVSKLRKVAAAKRGTHKAPRKRAFKEATSRCVPFHITARVQFVHFQL